jgi:hypothetical protein
MFGACVTHSFFNSDAESFIKIGWKSGVRHWWDLGIFVQGYFISKIFFFKNMPELYSIV